MVNQRYTAAQIIAVERNGNITTRELMQGEQFIFGRIGGANDMAVAAPTVTSQHGMFSFSRGIYTYIDLGSTNGTFLNGSRINSQPHVPSTEVVVRDGDLLTIAPGDQNQVSILVSVGAGDCTWNCLSLMSMQTVTVGRDDRSDIYIPNVSVSRNHAVIRRNGNGFTVQDLNSVNGTIVNGNTLRSVHRLADGDVIQINSTKLFYTNGCIIYNVQHVANAFAVHVPSYPGVPVGSAPKQEKPVNPIARKGGIEVQVKNVSRVVSSKKEGKKKILDNISLTIEKGDLVAILGGSGAGKTTFMNCINGFEGPTEGTVLIDGVELYKNYQTLKSRMGYVPQQDIVHDNLTLKDMLTYTGKLRLPKDDLKQTLDTRVREVIKTVDLTEQTNTLIRKLSGGQRKRASIAVELLSDPQLMFLDEPTSGLDPEAETLLMQQLQKLSREGGKTVVVVTHTLQNINLFDKVIFLAPGGKLCYYGTPQDACKFFEVGNLTDAYRKILDNTDAYIEKFNRSRGGY